MHHVLYILVAWCFLSSSVSVWGCNICKLSSCHHAHFNVTLILQRQREQCAQVWRTHISNFMSVLYCIYIKNPHKKYVFCETERLLTDRVKSSDSDSEICFWTAGVYCLWWRLLCTNKHSVYSAGGCKWANNAHDEHIIKQNLLAKLQLQQNTVFLPGMS